MVMLEILPINILIANKQAHEASEVSLSLRAFFPHSRIKLVDSADEVVQWAAKCEWDAILADVDLFRQCGLTTMTELKRKDPTAILIIQADGNDKALAKDVLRFGVDFYISKKSPAFLTELPFVLRTLLKNQDLNSQLHAAKKRVRQLEEQVAQTQVESAQTTEKNQWGRVREQLEGLRQERSETPAHREQLEKLRQAHTQLEEELQQVTGQLAQERGEHQGYKEQLERLRQEQSETQTHREQLEKLRRAHTQLEEELQRITGQLAQERGEHEGCKEQLERLRQEQSETQTHREQLEMSQQQQRHKQLEHRSIKEQ